MDFNFDKNTNCYIHKSDKHFIYFLLYAIKFFFKKQSSEDKDVIKR